MPAAKASLYRVCGLLALMCSSLMPDSGQVFIGVIGFPSRRGRSAAFSLRL
jgi:hypothetical protein